MFDYDKLEEMYALSDDPPPQSLDWQNITLSGVKCLVLMPSRGPLDSAIVFFHGSGQPWQVERSRIFTFAFSQHWAAASCIVLPASPLSNDSGQHWWYRSDPAVILDLLERARSREKAALSSETDPLDVLKDGEPAFLDSSRIAVLGLIHSLETEFALPVEKIVLAGFSQGAAVAMDCAFHLLPRLVAGVVFFSGSLMCRRRWLACVEDLPEERREQWRDVPLLQAHGINDFAVGVNGGRWLQTFCKRDLEMRCLDYVEFNGGHTIPEHIIHKFGKFLFDVFPGGVARGELAHVAPDHAS